MDAVKSLTRIKTADVRHAVARARDNRELDRWMEMGQKHECMCMLARLVGILSFRLILCVSSRSPTPPTLVCIAACVPLHMHPAVSLPPSCMRACVRAARAVSGPGTGADCDAGSTAQGCAERARSPQTTGWRSALGVPLQANNKGRKKHRAENRRGQGRNGARERRGRVHGSVATSSPIHLGG